MTSSLASRIDSKRCPCRRSTFSEPNNVSEHALSQQSPLRLIDGVMPCPLSTLLKSSLAYWLPRSLWKSSPAFLPGLRPNQAISSASMTRLLHVGPHRPAHNLAAEKVDRHGKK